MVAAMTWSPASFSTGILSPVMALSSTAAWPLRTVPSTGMRPPCRTITVSPASTEEMGRVTSFPSRTTTADSGAKAISAAMASPVLPLLRASKYLPTVTSAKIIPALSKYSSGISPAVPWKIFTVSIRL